MICEETRNMWDLKLYSPFLLFHLASMRSQYLEELFHQNVMNRTLKTSKLTVVDLSLVYLHLNYNLSFCSKAILNNFSNYNTFGTFWTELCGWEIFNIFLVSKNLKKYRTVRKFWAMTNSRHKFPKRWNFIFISKKFQGSLL